MREPKVHFEFSKGKPLCNLDRRRAKKWRSLKMTVVRQDVTCELCKGGLIMPKTTGTDAKRKAPAKKKTATRAARKATSGRSRDVSTKGRGRYVTDGFAEKNPDITVRERSRRVDVDMAVDQYLRDNPTLIDSDGKAIATDKLKDIFLRFGSFLLKSKR